MKPIVSVPNDVLTSPAKTVTVFSQKTKKLVKDLKNTLVEAKNPQGVGLAAPQIGEPWRVFVTRPTDSSPVRVFINPEITGLKETESADTAAADDKRLEGCLSIPKIWGRVKRSLSLTLKYQDVTGQSHEERFTGFMAVIIQHETDHLNGILFPRRVLEQQGKLYETAQNDQGKEVMEEITI